MYRIDQSSTLIIRNIDEIEQEFPFGFTIDIYATDDLVNCMLHGWRYMMIFSKRWVVFKPSANVPIDIEDIDIIYDILCDMSSRAVFGPRKICLSHHLLESKLPHEISSRIFQLWFNSTDYH